MASHLISAICTPLREDHSLWIDALEAHIEDQWHYGIQGLLVAGTMGLMQLQSDATYRDLVSHSVRIWKSRGELLVGVGDACFARTSDRIHLVSEYDIDAVVVLSPYLVKFSQAELIEYFSALADIAAKPLYLYDLPGFTGTKLELQTVSLLSKHPNIRGIKCSGAWEETRQLKDYVDAKFRIIPAQPHLVDKLVRLGVTHNLDGIFSVVPHLASNILQEAKASNWTEAARLQNKLSQLLRLLREKYTVFSGCEALLNARGIPGRYAPAPMRRLNPNERDQFLAEPIVQELACESRNNYQCQKVVTACE